MRFHVHMGVLPSTCACTSNFICTCVLFQAHVRLLGTDPTISYPILLYLPGYPCKNSGSRQGGYTYDPILNVPDKITVVPSMHTSPKLQLRRATLHYWPAGEHVILSYIVLYLPVYPCKNWGSRQGAYTYDLILFFFTCPSTPAKTGALGRGLIPMILSYSSLAAGVPLQKLGL